MGEMADLLLGSQDDIDFYEECAMQGYKAPGYAMTMPTINRAPTYHTIPSKRNSKSTHLNHCNRRVHPTGCWVDKNGEIQKICKMTDQYLNNLIGFLEKNPLLIKQNCASFEQMIEERYRRRRKSFSNILMQKFDFGE